MSYFRDLRWGDYAKGFAATALAVALLLAPFLLLWLAQGMPWWGWAGVLYLLSISVGVGALLPAQLFAAHRRAKARGEQ